MEITAAHHLGERAGDRQRAGGTGAAVCEILFVPLDCPHQKTEEREKGGGSGRGRGVKTSTWGSPDMGGQGTVLSPVETQEATLVKSLLLLRVQVALFFCSSG